MIRRLAFLWRLAGVPWTVMMMQGPEFIPPREPPPERPEPPRAPPAKEKLSLAEIVTLIVTNLTKLAGVAVGLIGLTDDGLKEDRMLVLLFAGFLIAGGEGAERFIGQLFGRPGGK